MEVIQYINTDVVSRAYRSLKYFFFSFFLIVTAPYSVQLRQAPGEFSTVDVCALNDETRSCVDQDGGEEALHGKNNQIFDRIHFSILMNCSHLFLFIFVIYALVSCTKNCCNNITTCQLT